MAGYDKLSDNEMESLLVSLYEDYNKSLTPEEIAAIFASGEDRYARGYQDGFNEAITMMRRNLTNMERELINQI